MPYKLNPVFPRSIYGVLESFFKFMACYMKNGMTDISMLMLKTAAVYTAAVFAACWVLLIARKR